MPYGRNGTGQDLLRARDLIDNVGSGLCHVDLHLNSIFLELPIFEQSTSEKDLLECIGEPLRQPVERIDKMPVGMETLQYSVQSAMMYIQSSKVENPKIIISDYGESFSDEAHYQLATLTDLLPPESFFQEH